MKTLLLVLLICSTAAAAEVDLIHFGNLQLGMTKGEVYARLGPPDLITDRGAWWHYVSSTTVVSLKFFDGKLVDKHRVRR